MVILMYRAAICDDNSADITYISNMVKKWASDTGTAIQIDSFVSAESFLFQYEEDNAYDILFLDIEMGKMSGIELARKIRRNNRTVQIIFITGYMEYIAEGYDVEALHYLLKPVTELKLREVLARAAEKLKHKEKELYIRDTFGGMIRIPLYEIRFLEVMKNYVTIHAMEDYTVKKPLHELERELDERFFRTGRSFIVNLIFVKKITRTQVFLKDGNTLPLSRNLYENINHAIIKYF